MINFSYVVFDHKYNADADALLVESVSLWNYHTPYIQVYFKKRDDHSLNSGVQVNFTHKYEWLQWVKSSQSNLYTLGKGKIIQELFIGLWSY